MNQNVVYVCCNEWVTHERFCSSVSEKILVPLSIQMAYIETGITLTQVQDKKLSSHSHLDVLEVANNLTVSPMQRILCIPISNPELRQPREVGMHPSPFVCLMPCIIHTYSYFCFLCAIHCRSYPRAAALCDYSLVEHVFYLRFHFFSILGWNSSGWHSHWVSCGWDVVFAIIICTDVPQSSPITVNNLFTNADTGVTSAGLTTCCPDLEQVPR